MTFAQKQKVILNTFGMDENDVRSTAAEISDLLTDNQSLQSCCKTVEDENGQNESITYD